MIIQLLTNINSPITDSYEDVKDEVIFQGLIFSHEGDWGGLNEDSVLPCLRKSVGILCDCICGWRHSNKPLCFQRRLITRLVLPPTHWHDCDALGLKWETVRDKESEDKRYAADQCQVTRHTARLEMADGCHSDGDSFCPFLSSTRKVGLGLPTEHPGDGALIFVLILHTCQLYLYRDFISRPPFCGETASRARGCWPGWVWQA